MEAEETAQNMEITRSALYCNVLNEVYGAEAHDDYYKEFEPISEAGLESIRELTKNWTLPQPVYKVKQLSLSNNH